MKPSDPDTTPTSDPRSPDERDIDIDLRVAEFLNRAWERAKKSTGVRPRVYFWIMLVPLVASVLGANFLVSTGEGSEWRISLWILAFLIGIAVLLAAPLEAWRLSAR